MSTSPISRRPRLLRLRLEGSPDAVAFASERVRLVLGVARESTDYPNRPPSPDVRRYLDVLIDGADLVAEEVRRNG
jgi:hypothetical protein